MLKSKLGTVKAAFEDIRGQLWRNRVGPHRGLPHHGMVAHQVYPQGNNLSLDFMTQPNDPKTRFIQKSTPVASMGSCFAVEIKQYLEKGNFNFITTEDSWAGSAGWGRVYTTKNMLQVIQYSFCDFWPQIPISHNDRGFFDPYREGNFFSTREEAEKDNTRHRREARNALGSCQVLVLTPGQNEAWITIGDGLAWARKPPPELFAEACEESFALKRYSLAENVENLDNALNILWQNNPTARVIFTVSPVPSSGTFFDVNVAVRSFENKANLLLAVKEVVNSYPQRAYYFPSFEMAVLSNNPNLQLDNRHVRPKVVKQIMDCFDQSFLADSSVIDPSTHDRT